ncbi:carbamoyltransferase HypF [Streptomyces sp. NPDC008313]|uniref:carbamoyltransferase HypF n=1 Tax=Streptomyces sp. NPDC008313 TaxID=3364826 RepID=UPI0036EABE5B
MTEAPARPATPADAPGAPATPTTAPAPAPLRRRIEVRGVVQGVGYRPFVHRLARELALAGFVGNDSSGVFIEIEGAPETVARFCARLAGQAPPLAEVTGIRHHDLTAEGTDGFTIRPSRHSAGQTRLPPDTATCEECLRELADPADRRHRHPFITCTHCGPRFTLTDTLPYDRATTTMADFPMCPRCAAEYTDPADRRFHAQPVACHDCGPRLTLTPAPGRGRPEHGEQALRRARQLLAEGRIVAVKGLGGYHLACDATDPAAVRALRARKARGAKPFAVMCADPATAESVATVTPAERAVLTGPCRPVVLLRRRTPSGPLADEVCPGSPHVGVMLPYTPVHQLLLGLPGDPPGPRLLVMTSGNRSGEPIVTDDAQALTRLAGLADAWLAHDRRVDAPCDDSVVRVRADGTTLVLRRARGYVPRPVTLPVPVRPALAVGGDLKNAVCLGSGHDAWFSPHIGDMGDLATLDALHHAQLRLRRLTGVTPRLLAADRHPGYHSARWAHRHSGQEPPRLVQHHHAHVASAMAQHGLDGTTPVIGVAFDGTGYGDDGTVWGGEVLIADYDGFHRFAHLTPAPLPGGDTGVANPCRTALARLRTAGLPRDGDVPSVTACSPAELAVLERQLERGLACVATSSMGRLFDAVSSLAGVCHRAGYEAQAAVELEAEAARAWSEPAGAYTFGIAPGHGGNGGPPPLLCDPAPVLRAVLQDVRRGTGPAVVAARFHRGVAAMVAEICERARRATGTATVVLTGGVFANALLEEECTARLAAAGFRVLRHGEVPPGDGGLALGQLVVAAREQRPGPQSP